jgi:hypothetical protein
MSILMLVLTACGSFHPTTTTTTPVPATTSACAAPNDKPATYFGVDVNIESKGIMQHFPQILQDIENLGAGWIRVGLPWSLIEPQQGVYQWSQADQLVSQIASYHLHILANLGNTPAWAAVGGQDNQYGEGVPANPQVFGQFAGTVAKHFAGRICAFKIYNEPYNSSQYWPGGTPGQYAATLAAAYTAIHQAAPGDLVLNGGIGCVSNPTNRSNGIAQNFWFYALIHDPTYPMGKYMDIESYHFDALGEVYAQDKVACTEAALASTGYSRPGWVDEWSYPSTPQAQAVMRVPGGYDQGEPSQSAYVVAWSKQMLSLSGIQKEFYTTLTDFKASAPQFLSTGLVTDDGTLKPAYYALQHFWKTYNGS